MVAASRCSRTRPWRTMKSRPLFSKAFVMRRTLRRCRGSVLNESDTARGQQGQRREAAQGHTLTAEVGLVGVPGLSGQSGQTRTIAARVGPVRGCLGQREKSAEAGDAGEGLGAVA